jgi:hypothetical protein
MRYLPLILTLLFPLSAFGLSEGTGLKFSAAVDLLGQFGAKDQVAYPRRFEPREAEFGVYGPIDHRFDGALFFAAHNEKGVYNLELHEAYLASGKLVQNLRLKAGKFFLGVGRLNQLHRHDWPFVNAPKAHRTFFDEEAVADSGVEASYLLGFLPIFTELTAGLTSGWTYGHEHNQGSRPIQPIHTFRAANFFPLGETGGLQTGLNYLGHHHRQDGRRRIFGLDLVAKWQKGAVTTWLLQSEIYRRNLRPPGAALEQALGGYLYLQRHLKGALFGGLRIDGYTLQSSPEKNLDYSLVPTLTYRHSEFALFRTAFQWDFEHRDHRRSKVNQVAQVQAVFFLGDHPSHDF